MRWRTPHPGTQRAHTFHTQGSKGAARGARSPSRSKRAALRPGERQAHPPDRAPGNRRRVRSHSSRASARAPRPPRMLATAPARVPRGRTGRQACVRTDPHQAATPKKAGLCSAAWSYYASCDSTGAQAGRSAHPDAQPALQACRSAHPSATKPPPQPRGPGHRSPPPQSAPHQQIRRSRVISPNPTERLQKQHIRGSGRGLRFPQRFP